MKIYVLHVDMTLILPRLKKFRLKEFNTANPIIFVEANDPDGACYECNCKFPKTRLFNKNSFSDKRSSFRHEDKQGLL